MIRVNRILAAIAVWINAVVWWREGKTQGKPYETLHIHRVEGKGIMLLVKRSPALCPRDVATLIWLPSRAENPGARDVHLFIDHLEGMARNKQRHTHQVTVALASHWPDVDGLYELEPLYCATADLQGNQSRRDLHTRKVLAVLAHPLAFDPPHTINWELQLGIAMKTCGLNAPKMSGVVVARDVATSQAIRINLGEPSPE